MKLKKLKKVIAISVAFTMAMPTTVFAAEPLVQEVQTEGDSQAGEAETPQEPEIPQEPEVPQETEIPQEPEKPSIPEALEDEMVSGTANVPGVTGQENEKEAEELIVSGLETPQAFEQRTGYKLPAGYHYVLDERGYIILLENGLPQIKSDDPNAASTNAELIARQQIVSVPAIKEDFRFWTVARKYAFAKTDIEIKEEMKDDARSVGRLIKNGVCYILKEEENGWLYAESGKVRGFVRADDILTGKAAQTILKEYQKRAREKADKEKETYKGIETVAPMAEELVSYLENKAFLHLRATVNQTVVKKEYAVAAAAPLNIREDKDEKSRTVGCMKQGSLSYILDDNDDVWSYVESADVRGFVKKEDLKTGSAVEKEVKEKGEEVYSKAETKIKPEENKACYYTLTSVKSGVPGNEVRKAVLEYASQFIGNPYVWGGESLTKGADCSGFVQSIYKEYGYELPRTAEEQAQCGTKIKVEDARPGDLVFYAKDGYIYHVAICAGDGRTVEAMGTNYGIVQGNLNTASAVWAVKILDDKMDTYDTYVQSDIAEVNAAEDMYGECLGNFKLTYYCSCEICCDVETGITATGAPVVEGRTIAVDPKVIPYGTKIIIGGHIFTAEDCGGAIKGNRIDIYVSDHDRANALGVNYADVYLLK